jgi:hypothetical protein
MTADSPELADPAPVDVEVPRDGDQSVSTTDSVTVKIRRARRSFDAATSATEQTPGASPAADLADDVLGLRSRMVGQFLDYQPSRAWALGAAAPGWSVLNALGNRMAEIVAPVTAMSTLVNAGRDLQKSIAMRNAPAVELTTAWNAKAAEVASGFSALRSVTGPVTVPVVPAVAFNTAALVKSWEREQSALLDTVRLGIAPAWSSAVLGSAGQVSAWHAGLGQLGGASWALDLKQGFAAGVLDSISSLKHLTAPFEAFTNSWAESLAQVGQQAAQIVRGLNRRLFWALLAAQHAAMIDDLAGVAAFAEQWTDLPLPGPRSARVRALADVLLSIDFTEFGPDDAFELVEQVEKMARRQSARRGSRPLTDTMLNHRQVVSLEGAAIFVGVESPEALLPCSQSAEDRAIAAMLILENPLLVAAMETLPAADARIVLARGLTRSWEDAVISCGVAPEDAKREAERVRSKFLRRAARLQRSGAAAGVQGRSR